jgi:hypothetical protein
MNDRCLRDDFQDSSDATVVADVNRCGRAGKANSQVTNSTFASQRTVIDSNPGDNGCVSAPAPAEGETVEQQPTSGEWLTVQDAESFLFYISRAGPIS